MGTSPRQPGTMSFLVLFVGAVGERGSAYFFAFVILLVIVLDEGIVKVPHFTKTKRQSNGNGRERTQILYSNCLCTNSHILVPFNFGCGTYNCCQPSTTEWTNDEWRLTWQYTVGTMLNNLVYFIHGHFYSYIYRLQFVLARNNLR